MCALKRFALCLSMLVSVFVVGGCRTLQNEMVSAETAYQQAMYDDALVWLAHLDDQVEHMTARERVRFLYLRGMTAYRVTNTHDALYYLSLVREEVALDPGRSLPDTWQRTMEHTLSQLESGPSGAGSSSGELVGEPLGESLGESPGESS